MSIIMSRNNFHFYFQVDMMMNREGTSKNLSKRSYCIL